MSMSRRKAMTLLPGITAGAALPVRAQNRASQKHLSLIDWESRAREILPSADLDYIIGGAAEELTVRWNREAYDRIRLHPRVLVDVSALDTSLTLLGQQLAFPILLAPTAFHRQWHPEGEIATARGAAQAGTVLVVSSASNTAVEEIRAATPSPLWFQLYIRSDRAWTRDLVQRVETAGFQALCLTVDSPVNAVRYRELNSGFRLKEGLQTPHLGRPGGPDPNSEAISPDTLTWRDIGWLRSLTRLPVLLKGILSPADAERAIREGASGVIVSNHGGRNLDTVPATIDALAPVAERVQRRVPVLVDGGVRKGTDVLKALARGADAVMIGRPYLFGLAVNGAPGVEQVVTTLRREFENAMAMSGLPSLRAITEAALWPE